MAVDKYINDRMNAWARWSLQRESGGLGFPRECPYTRMQQRSGGGFMSPDVDLDAMEIEHAVAHLPDYLRESVRVYYVAPGTIEQKLRSLRCGRTTLFTRIEQAQCSIKTWLEYGRKKSV